MPNNEKAKTKKLSSGGSDREEKNRKTLMIWLGRFCAVHQREMTELLASAYMKLLRRCPECLEKACEQHNYDSPFWPKPSDLKTRVDLLEEIHQERVEMKRWREWKQKKEADPAPTITPKELKEVDPTAFKILNGKRML